MNIKKCRRILSLLLCVMLILSSMSIPVFAEEAGGAPCAHGNTVAREEAGEAASCTAEGSHTVITECADCGEELSRESVTDKALGHDYRENWGRSFCFCPPVSWKQGDRNKRTVP